MEQGTHKPLVVGSSPTLATDIQPLVCARGDRFSCRKVKNPLRLASRFTPIIRSICKRNPVSAPLQSAWSTAKPRHREVCPFAMLKAGNFACDESRSFCVTQKNASGLLLPRLQCLLNHLQMVTLLLVLLLIPHTFSQVLPGFIQVAGAVVCPAQRVKHLPE